MERKPVYYRSNNKFEDGNMSGAAARTGKLKKI